LVGDIAGAIETRPVLADDPLPDLRCSAANRGPEEKTLSYSAVAL
jgi:hypothetical protein